MSSFGPSGEIVGKAGGGGKRGCGLIVDYGDEKAFGASFRVRFFVLSLSQTLTSSHSICGLYTTPMQAFKDHKIVDPLLTPGQCDLTANVDFAYLKEAMKGTGGTFLFSYAPTDSLSRLLP